MTDRPRLIATHNGTFHADDVFGVGVLMGTTPNHELIRTRTKAKIDAADFAVDVGGEWAPERGRFDHHQRGFDGARPDESIDGQIRPGVGYASAGLVWSVHGPAYALAMAASRNLTLNDDAIASIVQSIDHSLVQYLDMVDTGQGEVAPGIFGLSSLIAQLNTNWLEERDLDVQTEDCHRQQCTYFMVVFTVTVPSIPPALRAC